MGGAREGKVPLTVAEDDVKDIQVSLQQTTPGKL
ncbi:MAG: hypothetical protein Ct9H300mP18_11990 [Candidatus Neomarinimicrobiota bacterium]|nr:MAG: hypothetical protein Ct9H300mP18_11990 [Candidatus Neomarinimicrobiota bacterium]